MLFCTGHRDKCPIASFTWVMCRCAHENSVETGQRHRKEERNSCPCDHVLEKARVSTSPLHILSQQMSVDTQTPPQTRRAFLLDVVIRQIRSGLSSRLLTERTVCVRNTDKQISLSHDSDSWLTNGCGKTRDEMSNTWKSACTVCDLQNSSTVGTKQNRPAVLDGSTRLLSAQNVHLKTGARKRRDVRGSVNSCSLPLCGRSTKTRSHSWMTCLQNWLAISLDTSQHRISRARFSAQRHLMSCFTRYYLWLYIIIGGHSI